MKILKIKLPKPTLKLQLLLLGYIGRKQHREQCQCHSSSMVSSTRSTSLVNSSRGKDTKRWEAGKIYNDFQTPVRCTILEFRFSLVLNENIRGDKSRKIISMERQFLKSIHYKEV